MIPLTITQIASMLGLVISLYFLAIYKGWMEGNTVLVPKKVCQKDSCVSVLQSPFARVFRVQNFYLGIVYYIAVIVASVMNPPSAAQALLVILTWVVVGFSLYLAYALIVRLKVTCLLCFAAHILNVMIAITVSVIKVPHL